MDFSLSSPTAVGVSGLRRSSLGAEQPHGRAGLDYRAMETIRSLDRFVEKLWKSMQKAFFWGVRGGTCDHPTVGTARWVRVCLVDIVILNVESVSGKTRWRYKTCESILTMQISGWKQCPVWLVAAPLNCTPFPDICRHCLGVPFPLCARFFCVLVLGASIRVCFLSHLYVWIHCKEGEHRDFLKRLKLHVLIWFVNKQKPFCNNLFTNRIHRWYGCAYDL